MAKTTIKFTNPRFSNFCFTLNNYTWEDELQVLLVGLPVTYLCYGREVGEQGTPHLQGYAELNHPMRTQTIKNLGTAFEKMHIEKRKGTQKQAIDYTLGLVPGKTLNGEWFEVGTKKCIKQGQRGDLDEVRIAAMDQGMKEVSVWANLQEMRVAEKYLTYNEPKRSEKPIVTWLYGPTGTGKSRMAHLMFPDAYTKSDNSKWWDGYDRHPDVILDDFRADWMTFNELLTLLDRYERRIEFKGGCRQFVAKNIVITCCKHPKDLYAKQTTERVDQLLRRIDFIENLGPPAPVGDGNEVGGNTVAPTSNEPEYILPPGHIWIDKDKKIATDQVGSPYVIL